LDALRNEALLFHMPGNRPECDSHYLAACPPQHVCPGGRGLALVRRGPGAQL